MSNSRYPTGVLTNRMIGQLKPYWPHIAGIFLLSLLAIPTTLLKPLAIKMVIDSAFGNEPMPSFIRLFLPDGYHFTFTNIIVIAAVFVIVVALVENFFSYILWILSIYTGEKLVLDFRTRLFNRLQRLSLAYHDETGTSDALYKLQWDTSGIRYLLINNITPIVTSLITLVAMVAVMFAINWHFALIALGIIPLIFILIRFSNARLRNDWENVKQEESRAMAVVHEVLSALRVVKAFGQEKGEERRFVGQSNKAVKGQIKIAWMVALFNASVWIIFAIGTALFIFLGANYVQAGKMTLGDLTLMLAYLTQFFSPLQNISKNLTDTQSSLTSIERVFRLLDKEQEVAERPGAVGLHHAKGGFDFRQVSFGYNKNKETLQDLSFVIQPGDRVGIMGSTGAGKSSLISLLMRFYDPSSGEIFLDGKNLKDIKLDDYRSQFAIVLQEPVLFSTTVAENIRYGKPGATDKEMIEAAKAANAHEFIMRLKEGYNTLAGERGMQLSGGERQRISIARAFIKNAPILILDEPTSSLDIGTEAQIMGSIERLMEGRTTFLITHRLDTLKSCNVLLHLEKGRLVSVAKGADASNLEQRKADFLNRRNTFVSGI